MRRYVLSAKKEVIENIFSATSNSNSLFEPSYNVFAGSPMPIIYKDKNTVIKSGVWGISGKQRYTEFTMQQIETSDKLISKLNLKPCIIPASGFYLWKQSVNDRYPFYVRMLSREVLGLAGMYRFIENPDGSTSREYVVIIKRSNVLLQPLEPTMPCILDPENFEEWLQGNEKTVLQSQFKDTQLIPDLAVYRVPELVNDLSQNSEELIQAIPKLRNEE